MSPRREKLQIAVALVLVLIGAMLTSSLAYAQGPEDFALRHPLFAGIAKKYGKDWEKGLHPDLKTWVKYQRIIGPRALITGFSDQQLNEQNPNPKFTIFVTKWDKSDLLQSVLPQRHDNGKPIEIFELEIPKFAFDSGYAKSTPALFWPTANPSLPHFALD
ncbi:MAG: hypothetical protein HZB53_22020 [Chloroflexi bacterium]|nr:hypothetical protein [Chloroflexota bacterium]